ncbi:MAG TPA: PAS domain S-box protein, partial [Candidatus Sulfopaludibacter sp.]|nr:PAS domain S-box protein [Candidatus Sulfopaludibacter sp.]
MPKAFYRKRVAGYGAAVLGIAAVTAICAPFHQRFIDTTAALGMLLVVLFVALAWGHLPALLASVFGMLCLNFFFLSAPGAFSIANPEDWIALFAFFTTAVTVGELSARARRRAADAEAGRKDARRMSQYNGSLIEASIDPLVTIGKDGRITDANPAAETATGRSRTELVGTDFSDYFTEPEWARRGYRQVFDEGSVRDFPLEMRHRGGHVSPVLYNATVYRDDTGEVAGVLAAARDISKRKQAERELRETMQTLAAERKRFQDVLDILPAYVVLLTPDHHVPFTNRFFRERFGEPQGKRCFEYLFGRGEPCEVCHTYKVLESGQPVRWEWTGPDGRDYDIFDFPFQDAGDRSLILEMGLDITDRKRADNEIRSLARLQAALAEMGQIALGGDQRENVLDEAVELVARTLDVEYCNLLELLPHGSSLVLRSGAGWDGRAAGRTAVSAGADTQAGYTLLSGGPVIVGDLRAETRFSAPALLDEFGVVSGMSVMVAASESPYGVLEAYTRRRRDFTTDESHFLETVASMLGNLIERRRAGQALRESEASLNRAQEIAHIGSWRLDLRRNRLTWSDETFRIFDMPKGTPLTYEVFLEAVYPEDREGVDAAWSGALMGGPYDVEHRILVGGELKWVRERAKVEFDSEGSPVEGLGTIQDITARKLAQETLQNSANEIRDLYENAPCGYHSLDAEGAFVRMNHTELAWLGYSRDEVIGKMKISDILTPESRKTFWRHYPRFKEKGAVHDLELDLVRKDGTVLPAIVSASAIVDRDGAYRMSRSTVYDITERKRAESEIRRMS